MVMPRVLLLSCMLFLLGRLRGYDAAAQPVREPDIPIIERIVGIEGTEQGSEFKITVPQNDLDVEVDGFEIIPPMGMGSWAGLPSRRRPGARWSWPTSSSRKTMSARYSLTDL